MSTQSAGDSIILLGGPPRVHLLPPEIEGQRKVRAFRRSALAVLAASVLVVIVAIGAVSLLLAASLAQQASEQAQGLQLASQIKKYSAVTGVQTQVDNITTAQPVAVKGEILWEPYIASIQATLPAGVSITSIIAKLDPAPAAGDAAKTNPLNGDHVATVSVTAIGPQAQLTTWLTQLVTLKGVVTATPGAVAVTTDPALYQANVDLLLSADVVAERFPVAK
jgi:uncharacterized membrane protein YeiB